MTGVAILASSVAAIHAGCNRDTTGSAPEPPPPDVSVAVVEPRTVPIVYDFIGQTEASKEVEVRARVQGFLTKVAFKEGAVVQEGDLLFEIDHRSFQAELDMAKANEAKAAAELEQAEREQARLEELARSEAATQNELDTARTTVLAARAALELTRANVVSAELELSYTTIRAPLTGQIGKSLMQEGALVDPFGNSLLAHVSQVNPIYVSFSISEREILRWVDDVETGRIQLHQGNEAQVTLTLSDGTEFDQHGVLNFFDRRVNPTTGTAELRAQFENPTIRAPGEDDPIPRLLPGQFVRGHILGWERLNAIAVPQRAVQQGPTGSYVMVVTADDVAEMRPVTTGAWIGSDWIIEHGLQPGDRVVTDGHQKVRPGGKVKASVASPAPGAASDDAAGISSAGTHG